MEYKITGYKPEKLFHFFEEISAIPRGSGNEKGISDYLVKFAENRGLWVHQDEAYNVIIKKGGSEGAEDKPAVMLQGHLDMVCEKIAGVEHDFEKDGIDLVVKDGVLTANGTTLGADNGVAVALMLMVLDDEDIKHPPVECVFTTEEEVGLNGAKSLDKSLISARTMINMDSEDEGIATVSCAGGLRVECVRPVKREKAEGTVVQIEISGLLGGHSGMDINKERQNANILMGRMLHSLLKETDGKLINVAGGSKDNAIPRECAASLLYTEASEAKKAEELSCSLAETFAAELSSDEPDFSCETSVEEGVSADVLSDEDGKAVRQSFISGAERSAEEKPEDGRFCGDIHEYGRGTDRGGESGTCLLSPVFRRLPSGRDERKRLRLYGEVFGFETSFSGEYPGWSYKEESPVRKVLQDSYRDLFGTELKVEAIHAGLECGLFSDALPGLDAIAVGPTLKDVHTPDESLPLDSFERFYQFLKDVLRRLAEQ